MEVEMGELNSKTKKETYKDRFVEKLKGNYSNLSNIYYLCVILMSVCTLVVAWLLIANSEKVATFSEFFELFEFL